MDKPASDIVELIIAVDLNPSDPEEPINVRDVTVGDESGGNKTCKMCQRILDAVAKIDPEMEAAVDGKPVDEAIAALEAMAGGAPEDAQAEADLFDKAMSESMEDEPVRHHGGGGGFGKAASKALGITDDDEDEE